MSSGFTRRRARSFAVARRVNTPTHYHSAILKPHVEGDETRAARTTSRKYAPTSYPSHHDAQKSTRAFTLLKSRHNPRAFPCARGAITPS